MVALLAGACQKDSTALPAGLLVGPDQPAQGSSEPTPAGNDGRSPAQAEPGPTSSDGSSDPAGNKKPAMADGPGSGSPTPDAAMMDLDAATPETPANGTGPGDWSAGDYPPDLMAESYLEITGVPGQKGYTRQYKVHVPPSYDPEVPTPLVFCIHGLGQTPILFCLNGASMHEKSDEAGFLLVMPNGYMNSWNGGTCCGAASTEQLDDVALFRALLEEVGTHLNVDLDRVYATGLSNGAYMSYRLACDAADMLAAIAAGAGVVGINSIGGGTNAASDFTECTPSRPVPVLDMHGTQDPLIPYSLAAPSLKLIQSFSDCDADTMPAMEPASGGDTTCETYNGCPDNFAITACKIEGGGHCWFGSSDCGTGAGAIGMIFVGNNSDHLHSTDAAWDFLKRFHR